MCAFLQGLSKLTDLGVQKIRGGGVVKIVNFLIFYFDNF